MRRGQVFLNACGVPSSAHSGEESARLGSSPSKGRWCTFLGPFGRRIGEVRLQPLQRVDGWYLRRRVLLLQSTCGYKLTKDGKEFFHRYGILTSAKFVGSTPGSQMRPWIILMAWGLPRSSKQCSQLNMSDADDKACIAQSGEHKSR